MPPRTRQTAKAKTPAGNGAPGSAQPVTLDQLSPEDRARLLEEARAGQLASHEVDLSEAEAVAERRTAAIAELLDDRDHLRGCPGGRVEAYPARKPARPGDGIPAKDVTVVRCIECGGSTVLDNDYPAVVASLELAAAV